MFLKIKTKLGQDVACMVNPKYKRNKAFQILCKFTKMKTGDCDYDNYVNNIKERSSELLYCIACVPIAIVGIFIAIIEVLISLVPFCIYYTCKELRK